MRFAKSLPKTEPLTAVQIAKTGAWRLTLANVRERRTQ
ncbi:hypothetical protein ABIA45_001415 [Bradyrhizobium sp. USDA 336]